MYFPLTAWLMSQTILLSVAPLITSSLLKLFEYATTAGFSILSEATAKIRSKYFLWMSQERKDRKRCFYKEIPLMKP